MTRTSVALFLTTVALAGGTVACSKSPEAGEQGGDKERPAMTQPSSPSPSSNKGSEDGEGGEGGEGGEDGNSRKDGKGGKDGNEKQLSDQIKSKKSSENVVVAATQVQKPYDSNTKSKDKQASFNKGPSTAKSVGLITQPA
jgi:hypothetical protein